MARRDREGAFEAVWKVNGMADAVVIASQRANARPMTGSAKQSIAVDELPVSSHVDDKMLTLLGVG
jgi:hypothetical protein